MWTWTWKPISGSTPSRRSRSCPPSGNRPVTCPVSTWAPSPACGPCARSPRKPVSSVARAARPFPPPPPPPRPPLRSSPPLSRLLPPPPRPPPPPSPPRPPPPPPPPTPPPRPPPPRPPPRPSPPRPPPRPSPPRPPPPPSPPPPPPPPSPPRPPPRPAPPSAPAQAAAPSVPAAAQAVPIPAVPRAAAVATSFAPQPEEIGPVAAPQPLPAPGEPEELGDRALSRHTVRAVATPPSGLALPGLTDGPLIITDDGTGVAPLLAKQLGARGIRAEIVTEVPAGAGSVILLEGLRQISSAGDAVAVNQAAFRAARQAASQLQSAAGVFVTVQDTGGDFGLTGYDRDGAGTDPRRAWLGGLAGLARTAALEWPHAAVRAIDCARAGRAPDVIAAAIADELIEGGPAVAVGLRGDGTRITVGLEAAPARPGRARINGSSVIVATGGARGVTAVAMQALARAYRPRLLLLGRRPLTAEPDGLADAPDEASLIRLLAGRQPGSPAEIAAAARGILAVREAAASLAAIEQAGAAVRYLPADIRDRAALAAALEEVRRSWGPVTGVVHGAGLLADSMIGSKTDEQFTSVFSPKVDGLRALLDVTADDPLDLLCAFSSIAAYAGNP